MNWNISDLFAKIQIISLFHHARFTRYTTLIVRHAQWFKGKLSRVKANTKYKPRKIKVKLKCISLYFIHCSVIKLRLGQQQIMACSYILLCNSRYNKLHFSLWCKSLQSEYYFLLSYEDFPLCNTAVHNNKLHWCQQ